MGKRVNAEFGERGLGLGELDNEEEEKWVLVKRVVGEERGGEEREFGEEGFEAEVGFGVEIGGVEEDEERERARGW